MSFKKKLFHQTKKMIETTSFQIGTTSPLAKVEHQSLDGYVTANHWAQYTSQKHLAVQVGLDHVL